MAWRGVAWSRGGCLLDGIYVAFSPDGIHWTRYDHTKPQIIGQSQSAGIESPYADEVKDGNAPMDNTTSWPIPFGLSFSIHLLKWYHLWSIAIILTA